MNEATLVGECAVAANEWLSCDRCLEGLDAEHILNDLFGDLVNLGVHQSDMVVSCDNVSERRKSFFDSLDADALW